MQEVEPEASVEVVGMEAVVSAAEGSGVVAMAVVVPEVAD